MKIKKSKKINPFEELLLKGPVATRKQLKTIYNNRKAINKWRTK